MHISSNGRRTQKTGDGIDITYEDGHYRANTPIAAVSHEQNGIRQSGTSRNVEISGNSQECYAGRGVTSEYNIKMVGSPTMFTGRDQKTADAALNELKSLMLQPGDNGKELNLASLPTLDFQAATSSMTTSMTDSFTPQPPQINRLEDLPMFTAYMGTWLESVSVSNALYQSACAGALEIERQIMQKKQSIKRLAKKFGDLDFQSLLGGNIGLPSTEDVPDKEYNITRSRVYETYIPQINTLLAAQNNIS